MKVSRLPRHEYILTEKDFLRMMSGYIERKQGSTIAPKFWFGREDFVLTLEIQEEKE